MKGSAIPRHRGLTPRLVSSWSRAIEGELALDAELLSVQVVSDQARDERALLVTALHAILLEAIQLFPGEEDADLEPS
jgi:hypothetical protein